MKGGSDHGYHFEKLEIPHSREPFRAKKTSDPGIYFHEYEDFPPDFYKAEFYHDAYMKIMQQINAEERLDLMNELALEGPEYKPLKIHSLAENGFFYYDDHSQTSFRDETGYDAYFAGHQSTSN